MTHDPMASERGRTCRTDDLDRWLERWIESGYDTEAVLAAIRGDRGDDGGGIDLDRLEDRDGSALFYALDVCASPEFVLILLDAGADPEHDDHAGRSTLAEAAHCEHSSVVSAILDRSPSAVVVNGYRCLGDTALHVAAEKGDLSLAQRLLALGADPDAGDGTMTRDRTPLTIAVDRGHAALVDLLDGHGARWNLCGGLGTTATDALARIDDEAREALRQDSTAVRRRIDGA